MTDDKILQALNYLEEKHEKTFNDIYDARVTRQLNKEEKQRLIELLKGYKETLKETEKQISNLLYSVKIENLKYRTFSHINQEKGSEENLFCTINLDLNKVSFSKMERKIQEK